MTDTKVHLEDVTRAARQGAILAAAVSLLGLAVMLAAGLALPFAIGGSAAMLAAGTASGGFGLIARVAMPAAGSRRRPRSSGGASVQPLRVPQTR